MSKEKLDISAISSNSIFNNDFSVGNYFLDSYYIKAIECYIENFKEYNSKVLEVSYKTDMEYLIKVQLGISEQIVRQDSIIRVIIEDIKKTTSPSLTSWLNKDLEDEKKYREKLSQELKETNKRIEEEQNQTSKDANGTFKTEEIKISNVENSFKTSRFEIKSSFLVGILSLVISFFVDWINNGYKEENKTNFFITFIIIFGINLLFAWIVLKPLRKKMEKQFLEKKRKHIENIMKNADEFNKLTNAISKLVDDK